MKGIRHLLRDFTASAVKEHLRSQIENTDGPPDFTKNEIELVRFIREGSFDWAAPPGASVQPPDHEASVRCRGGFGGSPPAQARGSYMEPSVENAVLDSRVARLTS